MLLLIVKTSFLSYILRRYHSLLTDIATLPETVKQAVYRRRLLAISSNETIGISLLFLHVPNMVCNQQRQNTEPWQ